MRKSERQGGLSMDHTEIIRRCDEISAAIRAKGYSGYASVSCSSFFRRERWECVAGTGGPGSQQLFGIGRRFDSPEAALAATLSDVLSNLRPHATEVNRPFPS
jgi:hypothetical protein